jgi:predicted RNase H-like nuclease
VSWAVALDSARNWRHTEHVVAIDQPLVVPNLTGMRPVEKALASALMRGFRCGAHPANTRNPCFGLQAGIWDLLEALDTTGYVQWPRAVCDRRPGRFYLECYPHTAILGLFDVDQIIRYKVHHRRPDEWRRLLALLESLAGAWPAVGNVEHYFPRSLPQTKRNEDATDAFIAAYVGAYLYEHGLSRSAILGDVETGYIVTPVSARLRTALEARFSTATMAAAGVARSRRPVAQDRARGA